MLKHNLNKWPNNSDHYFSAFFYVTISEVNIKKKTYMSMEKSSCSAPINKFCNCWKVSVFPCAEVMPEPLAHGIVWCLNHTSNHYHSILVVKMQQIQIYYIFCLICILSVSVFFTQKRFGARGFIYVYIRLYDLISLIYKGKRGEKEEKKRSSKPNRIKTDFSLIYCYLLIF